jgi:hypothetical protein
MSTFTATERRSHALTAVSHGGSYNVINLTATVEITASTTVGRTISFGYIPSNARILMSSKLYSDDLATGAAPTLDIGLAAVNDNLVNADDPNAIGDAIAISGALSGVTIVTEAANAGLEAWDFVASETVDPGGVLEVYGTMVDAVVDTAGTMTLDFNYVVD